MVETATLDRGASGTAMATAFMRALAAHDPGIASEEKDGLAEIFLDEEHKKPLMDPVARTWVMKNRLTPGAYEFMIARTAFFDQIFRKALQAPVGQIVLLGAGYDSRPYRFGEHIQKTRIFELDQAETQQRKKDCLLRAKIPISSRIRFVPVNFETDDWGRELGSAGYLPREQTLFLWEGVTYYLSSEAVDRMLAFVGSNSPAGSFLAFDYACLSEATLNEDQARDLRERMRSQYSGERTRFGIPAGEIESFMTARGFGIIEHLTADEMSERFLAGQGNAAGKVPSLFCLVHAEVRSRHESTKR